MSSSPTTQLDSAALDTLGLSVATSPAVSTDTRRGSIYDPTTWAAAAPVWFHPVTGQALMLATRRWSAGTFDAAIAGSYTAFTEDTAPSWAMISAFTGQRSAVPGQPVNLPMHTTGSDVSLIGAVSIPPGLLFVLSAATVGGIDTAVLQRYQLGINGSVALSLEEVLPTTSEVTFTAGLQFDGQSLIVYGTDSSHQVYKMSKPFGQVGLNTLRSVPVTKYTASDAIGIPRGWRYYTGTGYSLDPAEISPLLTSEASVLTTRGPMSFGVFRNQNFMTTVNLSGTTYSGQFWRSRSGMAFEPISAPVALGDSSAGTYLGGGIYLQPQLAPNPAVAPMTTAGVFSGILYVSWKKLSAGSGHVLDVAWGILAVTA
jgi:hypothetical protein